MLAHVERYLSLNPRKILKVNAPESDAGKGLTEFCIAG